MATALGGLPGARQAGVGRVDLGHLAGRLAGSLRLVGRQIGVVPSRKGTPDSLDLVGPGPGLDTEDIMRISRGHVFECTGSVTTAPVSRHPNCRV
jgi:hypothetical protein